MRSVSGSGCCTRRLSPVSTAPSSAASATVRPKPPTVSIESAFGFTPARGTRPKLGLKPAMPQQAAGRISEPAVCVPRDSGTMKSATAAAEPLDEPPGVCAGLKGLRVAPAVMLASSVVTVLPITTAPASRHRATAAASTRGRWPAKIGEPHSVGRSRVSKMSFTPSGRPCKGPRSGPASSARACANAPCTSRQTKARSSPSRSAMRARQARSSASALSSRRAISAAAVVASSRLGSSIRCGAAPIPARR